MPTPLTPEPEDLNHLLARAGAGDGPALGELLRRYEPRLKVVARTSLRSKSLQQLVDSMDLVQSVHREMISILVGGRYRFDDQDKLIGMAVRVLQRKLLRHAQRILRANEHEAEYDFADPGAADPGAALEPLDQVDRLLRDAHPEDRRVFELLLQGLSNTEIAARLGTTAGAVRARLCRARYRLEAQGESS